MRVRALSTVLVIVVLLVAPKGWSHANSAGSSAYIAESVGKLPLHFEPNVGQTEREGKFFARGRGYRVYLASTEVVSVVGGETVRLLLLGADAEADGEGIVSLPGVSHYLVGNDRSKWHRNVPHYSTVRFSKVYPGIDVLYYGNEGRIEYDFLVEPGADASRIRLRIEGADVSIDEAGQLLLRAGADTIAMHAPRIYQEVKGTRRSIRGGYHLGRDRRTVSFWIGAHDRGLRLVIDPVIVYSSFLGGSVGETASGIAVDVAGNTYVTGTTSSPDFPRVRPLQPTYGGGYLDAFVSKISADGRTLLFSTYLGGNGNNEGGLAIVVDPSGNAYVTGETSSTNFPTVNPLQATLGGYLDAFLTKIDATGSALVYSTYLGGSNSDLAGTVAIDTDGNAYLTGLTLSTDFPTTANAVQPNYGGGFQDAFVAKVDATGSALAYATYLGGDGTDTGRGIAVDSFGQMYVAGETFSTDFPLKNPLQGTVAGTDAFVTKIVADGSSLVYSTYLGGSGLEDTNGIKIIAADDAGNAYVTGQTFSADFPTVSALQPVLKGSSDAFVAKINADGSALLFSTYLGGSSGDDGHSIKVDRDGKIYVTGETDSLDFPTLQAFQAIYGGTYGDAFVTKITGDGSSLIYSSYLGGTGELTLDRGDDVAVDAVGNAYLCGQTYSADFPTVNAFQPVFGGEQDGFVTKIGEVLSPAEISNVTWASGSKSALQWSPEPNTTTYHVYRGVPPDLRKLLDSRVDSCLRLSTSEPMTGAVLTEVPPVRTFFWYLVRGENAVGLGPVGNATAGPRIQDSSGDCP